MADFLDKLKHGLGKGITTVTVKWKEMLDANRAKSQIADVDRQKKDALAELGTTVCTMLDGGRVDEDMLKAARTAIGRFDDQIKEKQEELARIHAEAQQALAGPQQAPSGTSQAAACVCGAPIAVGAKFCGSCWRNTELPQQS